MSLEIFCGNTPLRPPEIKLLSDLEHPLPIIPGLRLPRTMFSAEDVAPYMAIARSYHPGTGYGFAIHQALMVQEGEDMGSDLGGEELDEIYRKQWLAMSR